MESSAQNAEAGARRRYAISYRVSWDDDDNNNNNTKVDAKLIKYCLQEIHVTRQCPPHRQMAMNHEKERLIRLGHSRESASASLPSIPPYVQDFPATAEQQFLCDKHLRCTLAGVDSKLGNIIRSWSAPQREYHENQKAGLEGQPSVFDGRRVRY